MGTTDTYTGDWIGCIIGELVDVTSHVNSGLPQETILYVFIGLTIAIGQSWAKKEAKKEKAIGKWNET